MTTTAITEADAPTRKSAFDTLGVPLLSTTSAEEALALGGLTGWNVRKAPSYATDPVTGVEVAMPHRYGVLFDHPTAGPSYLGNVGESYTIIQNEDSLALLQLFADEAGATFETAGWARGGTRVFVTMKLPGAWRIGGVDVVDNYITSLGSHDGSAKHVFMVTPMRFACMNMLNVTLNGRRGVGNNGVIRVRHTRGAKDALHRTAQQILKGSFGYMDEFTKLAERMAATTLTQRRFEEIVEGAFGAGDDAPKATVTRCDAKVQEITRLFADAATQDGIRETVWAGFNAITEWAEHTCPTRGEDAEARRAEKSLLDPWLKNKALELMLPELESNLV